MKLRKSSVYSFEFVKAFEKCYGEGGWNKQNLESFLFGDCYGDKDSDYYLSKPDYYYVKSKITHRLNMLWAWPFTLICYPFQYILKGEVGWSERTIFGKWILKVCGYIKE